MPGLTLQAAGHQQRGIALTQNHRNASAALGQRNCSVRRQSAAAAFRTTAVARPGRANPKCHGSSRASVVPCAAHTVYEGQLVAHAEGRYAVVVARFNDLVTKLLLDGAMGTLQRHGVSPDNIDVVWVPGSFELPVVAKSMAETAQFDAVICIGTVVRGATTHYEAVVNGATSGVLGASTSTGVPVIFGVLTCDTMEQALDRAGGKVGNKGGEAAMTAIEMGNLMRQLRADGKAAPVSRRA